MALSIVTSANINDSTSSYDVTVGGKLLSNARVTLVLKIRGVIVASTYTYGTNAYFTGVTASEIYANAAGQSLTGAVEIVATELNLEEDLPTQTASKIGNITINYRMSLTLTTPTISNKINLDLADPTNVAGSWSRVTTDFVGIIVIQVGNKGDGTSTSWTTVYTSSNLSTSVNVDIKTLGVDDEIIAAMGGASPKDIRIQLYTRFRTGSSSYTTLGTGVPRVVAGAFEKIFFTGSDVAINPFTIDTNLAANDLPFTLTTYVVGATHALKLYVNSVLIKTVTGITASGLLPIDSADITAMLSATDQVTTCNAYIEVTTTYSGVNEVKNSPAVIATVGAGYVPAITAQSHAENTTSPNVASLIGKYVKGHSTLKFLLSGNTTGTWTRIKQIKVVFGGQTITIDYTYASNTTTLTNAQLITALVNVAGTGLVAVLTMTDYRNRSTTYTFNTIEVLDYVFPQIISCDVIRANSDGSVNGVGVFMNVVLNASVQSLINSTQKNELYYRIGYKVKGAGSYTYYSAVDTNALTFDDTVTKGTAVTQEFDPELVYDIVVEVYDVLTSANKSLSTETLPYGQVAMMWGDDWVSIGKVYSKVGALDVGVDANQVSINLTGGIRFPSTANLSTNANTLDDYEEGTWTPTIYGTTTEGTGTYSQNTGSYTKIGNTVRISMTINCSAHNGTGDMRIAGLPFSAVNAGFANSALSIRPSGLTLTANNVACAIILSGNNYIPISQYPVGGGTVTNVAVDGSVVLVISGTYITGA